MSKIAFKSINYFFNKRVKLKRTFNLSGKYRVRFSGGTTLGQRACLYARAGLVVHL